MGQFTTTVQSKGIVRDLEYGVAIIATGAHSLKPDLYLYGQDDRVTRWHDIEEMFVEDPQQRRRGVGLHPVCRVA